MALLLVLLLNVELATGLTCAFVVLLNNEEEVFAAELVPVKLIEVELIEVELIEVEKPKAAKPVLAFLAGGGGDESGLLIMNGARV